MYCTTNVSYICLHLQYASLIPEEFLSIANLSCCFRGLLLSHIKDFKSHGLVSHLIYSRVKTTMIKRNDFLGPTQGQIKITGTAEEVEEFSSFFGQSSCYSSRYKKCRKSY